MNRPNLSRDEALKIPGVADLLKTGPVFLGIRGYYKDTMGKSGENDRGIYDDAAAIIGPGGEYQTFNWNTDPSKQSPGMAVLQPGTYLWRQGLHGLHHLDIKNNKPDELAYKWLVNHSGQDHPSPAYRLTYWAFRQAGPVTVLRDGQKMPETKIPPAEWPYIDGHHGGLNGTSSEGCQTCPLEQWQELRAFGYGLMDKYKQEKIPYVLIEK